MTETKIGPGPEGVPHGPPTGYQILKNPSKEIGSIAKSLLKGEYGTITHFELGNKKYLARVEPHPPYKSSTQGPTSWHKGVTVYEPIETGAITTGEPTTNKTNGGRMRLLERITKFLEGLSQGI